MIEEIQYNPVAFQNVTPVLDVGDPSQSFLDSVRFSTQGMKENFKADMAQYLRNQDVEEKNMERRMEDMKGLMKLSSKATETYVKYQNQRTKQKLSEIWATAFQEGPNVDEEALYADYEADEKDQAETAQVVGEGLSQNLNKKEEPTTQDIADAGRLRKYSGLEAVVAANARSAAAMQSYAPALSKWLAKVQPEPGAATNLAIGEFNKRWSDATGMSQANPGYTAKYVYPTLRREAAAENEAYTRGWNAAESAKQKDILLQGLSTGQISLSSYFTQMKGLVKADGKTLMNNDDVWSSLRGKFTTDQLTRLGQETFKVTGQAYAAHPRFQTLLLEARQRRNQEYNLGRAETRAQAINAFNLLGPNATRAQMDQARDILIASGVPVDQAEEALSNARSRSVEALKGREWRDKIDRWMEANPGKKVPPEVFDGAPLSVVQQYQGVSTPSAQAETANEIIRDTQLFKDFSKDFKSQVKSIVGMQLKFANQIKGTTDPVNFNQFKTQALNEITASAHALMLGDPSLTADKAFETAKQAWIQATEKKHAAKELWDRKSNSFLIKPDVMTGEERAAAGAEFQTLSTTKRDNIGEGLNESDYMAPTTQLGYSERVRYLARRFGITPKEVVDLARDQAGLPKLENSPADDALAQIPKPLAARIASVDSPPSQLALRAQITSGQTLTGTARERTVAVGRQLIELGYGGIWQHPDFNYDAGFTGTGKEEHFREGYNSAHNHGEALDIGLAANGPQKLEAIYQYLLKNKERFGIRELFYAPKGSGRYDPDGSHWHHVHVSFDHRTQG